MDKKTRIKILYGITKGSLGGAQKYVYDLATSLPKDLYDVAVLIGTDGPLSQKLQATGVRTIILGNLSRDIHLWGDFWAFWRLLKIIRQERPNVLHLNSSKMGFLGAIAGRFTQTPKIIFTGHGWAFNEDRGILQRKMIQWLHLLTICLAHKTIAVSGQTKNQIAANDYFSRKITVVRNGLGQIDFLAPGVAREKLSQKLPAEYEIGNRSWLGTISELHKNKGLKYIIEAMHLLEVASDDRSELPILVIIGEGERREKLQERIDRYGLDDTVFLIGRLPEAEKYLKAFDIFTLTSITEALPYAVLEAGQAGLPIVASGVGGIPEIIDDMRNGILVRPREPEEIEKALEFLLNNPEKRAAFGQSLQKKILIDFSKERMVKETLALY